MIRREIEREQEGMRHGVRKDEARRNIRERQSRWEGGTRQENNVGRDGEAERSRTISAVENVTEKARVSGDRGVAAKVTTEEEGPQHHQSPKGRRRGGRWLDG